jgi:hypothetical protein
VQKILPCACRSAYQDQTYGTGQRLHNQTRGKAAGGGYRCTVCDSVKND